MIFNVFSSLSLLVMFGGERFRVFFFFFLGRGTMTQRDPARLLQLIMTMPEDDNNNKYLLVEP